MKILLLNPGRRDYLVKYFLDLSNKFNLKIFILTQTKIYLVLRFQKKLKTLFVQKQIKKLFIFFKIL